MAWQEALSNLEASPSSSTPTRHCRKRSLSAPSAPSTGWCQRWLIRDRNECPVAPGRLQTKPLNSAFPPGAFGEVLEPSHCRIGICPVVPRPGTFQVQKPCFLKSNKPVRRVTLSVHPLSAKGFWHSFAHLP